MSYLPSFGWRVIKLQVLKYSVSHTGFNFKTNYMIYYQGHLSFLSFDIKHIISQCMTEKEFTQIYIYEK